MTDQELIDYYASLLILQYVGLPKAHATIEALAELAIINQLPAEVRDAFSLGGSIGVQLDTIGKYSGVTRYANGPSGPITLDDDDFTSLIRIAIIRNTAGSSLYTIQDLLGTYFPNQIFVFDFTNMRMGYYIDSDVGSIDFLYAVLDQGLLPKPMGVELSATIYGPIVGAFFGYRTYELPAQNVSPFNTYEDYHMDWPWLDYDDAIIF